MAYYASVLAALRAAVLATWTDLAVPEVSLAVQWTARPLEQRAVPACAVEFAMAPSGEWGGSNMTEAGVLRIYRIESADADFEAVIADLEALQRYLFDNDSLTSGQGLGLVGIDFSLDLPLNAFFRQTQRPLWAGAVVIPIVAGENVA